MEKLFEETNFDEAQKKVKCKIMINHNETREMTLEELIRFMKELREVEHSQYCVPVRFWYGQLTQEIEPTVISNKNQFTKFISHLYYAYRKIEYPTFSNVISNVLSDPDYNENHL